MTDELFYRFCIFLLFAFVILTCICLTYKKLISRLEEKVNLISYTQFVTRIENLDASASELKNILNSDINRENG